MSCDHRGRDWSDLVSSGRLPRLMATSNIEESQGSILPRTSERAWPCWYLECRLGFTPWFVSRIDSKLLLFCCYSHPRMLIRTNVTLLCPVPSIPRSTEYTPAVHLSPPLLVVTLLLSVHKCLHAFLHHGIICFFSLKLIAISWN